MKNSKKVSKPKLVKKAYIVKQPFMLGSKQYNRGDSIKLTEQGRAYYESIKKI